MNYQVTEKVIPEKIVYTSETVLKVYSDMMQWIPAVGEECLSLNPGMECADPPYEFCEYLDGEYKETDIRIRHNEAVKAIGKENDHIKFKTLPESKVLSIYHKGSYANIGEAYAFLMHNLYKITTIQILTFPHNSIKIWCYGGKSLIKIHSFACKREYCSGYGYHFDD